MKTPPTSKMAKSGVLTLLLLTFFVFQVVAQRTPVIGDFRTKGSGSWDSPSIWQIYTGETNGSGWRNSAVQPTGQQIPGPGADVFIQRGHTVTLNRNEVCNSLYISSVEANNITKATLTIGNNTLTVNGKLMGYTGVTGDNSGDGTISGSNRPVELSTSATGKIRFAGASRNIIEAYEWAEATNNFNVEIALNNNATATLGRAFGVKDMLVTSGNFDASNKQFTAEGNVTVGANSTFSSLASGLATPVISNLAGTNGGIFTVTGTLVLKGAEPVIDMSAINFANGTVVYNGGTAPQTIISTFQNTPVIYNNLSLATNQEKSLVPGAAITITGNLDIASGSKLVLKGGQLGLNGNVTGAGMITSDAAASIIINGTGDLGSLKFTTGAQVIKSLTLNRSNNGVVALASPLTVRQALELHRGVILSTSVNLLTLQNAAAVTGGSPESYIAGPLSHQLSIAGAATQLDFPIGKDGAYRPVTLTMTHSSAGTNTYIAEQFNTAPASRDFPATIKSISTVRYFSINQSGSATISAGKVALAYSADEGLADGTEATIVKSANTTQPWTDLGRSTASTGTASGTLISDINFTTFSDFAVAKLNTNPLPVELISFEARVTGNRVNLNWTTASEKNNEKFLIERSRNGEVFERIGEVTGKGTTTNTTTYTFTDASPVGGTSYYRLKQQDFDGTAQYSKLVAVTTGSVALASISVYPNPVADVLTIALDKVESAGSITITDLTGTVLQHVNLQNEARLNLPVSALPKGVYIIKVNSVTGTVVEKFVKN